MRAPFTRARKHTSKETIFSARKRRCRTLARGGSKRLTIAFVCYSRLHTGMIHRNRLSRKYAENSKLRERVSAERRSGRLPVSNLETLRRERSAEVVSPNRPLSMLHSFLSSTCTSNASAGVHRDRIGRLKISPAISSHLKRSDRPRRAVAISARESAINSGNHPPALSLARARRPKSG